MIKKCSYCEKEFEAIRSTKKFCNGTCRDKYYYYKTDRKKKYRKENKEKYITYIRDYREKNKKVLKEKRKVYCEKNKDKISEYMKKYCVENKNNLSEKHKKRLKKYYDNNILYNITNKVRRRIHHYLESDGKRGKTSEEILGCSYKEYKLYLENLFVDGMSWGNRYEWHIDHMMPLASATNEDKLLELFHYSNTQPLWKIDNLKKGSKIIK